jgi:hypothetical protein
MAQLDLEIVVMHGRCVVEEGGQVGQDLLVLTALEGIVDTDSFG